MAVSPLWWFDNYGGLDLWRFKNHGGLGGMAV